VIVCGEFEEIPDDAAQDAVQLFLDRLEPLQVSETAISPHRAPARAPALDLQGQSMVFYRIKVTARAGRFERR
jgi:hypothetical protein